MKRRFFPFCTICLLLITAALLLSASAWAQEQPVTHSTLLGIGRVRQLDTYLSPLSYRGPQLQFIHQTERTTHWMDSTVIFQTFWQGDLSYTTNKPERARTIGGDISFDASWHFQLLGNHPFRIYLGPQIGTSTGFLYNTRNGNNPAQALASLHLSASAAATYDFHLWRQPLTARYQLDLPLLGLMFSPNYGQSYYEIFSLGQTDHNICVTHPFNAFSSRHLLSIDIPLRNSFTLRAGYLCDIRQSNVNEIRHHNFTHAFMIGWVRRLRYVNNR